MAGNTDHIEETVNSPRHDEQGPKPPDWLVENIAEASKNARKIYFLYISFLAYCALTIVSTSDRQIILNETVSLPILRIDVSLNGFFILAPLIAIFLFCYLQLYLNIRKGLIDTLKTNFPSVGGEYLYPWILVVLDYPKQGFIGKFQLAIVKFSLWASMPMVLILIAIWFVKKHDPILSYVIGSAPIVGIAFVFWFWCHFEESKLKIKRIPKFVSKNLGKTAFVFSIIIFEILFLFFIIPWAMEGGKFEFLRPVICINLSNQKLVTEPATDYEGLFWANFNRARLEGGNLTNTILKRADLTNALLQHAVMNNAILEKAKLWNSKLQEAFLIGAKLQEANLYKANLQGARLIYANFQGARLMQTNLKNARLSRANLQGANLLRANLQGAVFHQANLQKAILEQANLQEARYLTVEQLSKVKTLYEAKLDPELMKKIKKDYPHLLEKPKEE